MHDVKANGAEIPALGFGTWTLTGEACTEMVAHALAVGYRHLDTAAMYDNEREVGEGLRASGLGRDEIFLTTKVWWSDIAPGDLERSAEASLKRLGVDHVDLLLVHWPNPEIPLRDTMRSLNAVRAQGMTSHIGVSNFTTGLLAEALRHCDAPLVANQVEYHPYLNQRKVYAACREAGMAMVSYCPLFRAGPLFAEPAVERAAAAHGKTSAQIVLRWHVQQDGVAAIPRTTKKERLAENFDIFDFELSEAEMDAISGLRKANRRIADYSFSPVWDTP